MGRSTISTCSARRLAPTPIAGTSSSAPAERTTARRAGRERRRSSPAWPPTASSRRGKRTGRRASSAASSPGRTRRVGGTRSSRRSGDRLRQRRIDVAPPARRPVPDGDSLMKRGRAIIVGAGIVGAACARTLARDRWDVRVVDGKPVGLGGDRRRDGSRRGDGRLRGAVRPLPLLARPLGRPRPDDARQRRIHPSRNLVGRDRRRRDGRGRPQGPVLRRARG